MSIDLSAFRQGFFDEAREHTASMERDLLSLEKSPDNAELLNGIFRAAHSIKGAAGTLGFPEIAEFTHLVEGILDAMRHGALGVTAQRLAVLLNATDDIRRLIAASEFGESLNVDTAPLRAQFALGSSDAAAAARQPLGESLGTLGRRLRLTLQPTQGFFATGLDPILIFRDLEKLGQLESVVCDLSQIPRLSELVPDQCLFAWTLVLRTQATDDAIADVFLFITDDCKISLVPEEELPVKRGAGEHPAAVTQRQAAAETSTLRVTSEKVDSLIDLVGELVIAQSMVMQQLSASSLVKTPMLRDAISSMTRNMQELQERVMGIRMVPIGTLFGRFARIVHDVAAELGKSVHLVIEGQDTEIDKAVVERLADPITHLVRNALDHGLETDEERRRLGKVEPPTLRLAARHVAGGIIVEVSENGRGLNTQHIRKKAEELGLLSPADSPSDDQIHSCIFEPGFSTAAIVSNLSGRGVGMDVVRRCVDSLNGTIAITTALGEGTSFQIRLPLTLAILDGLLLRVSSQTYILPLLAVVESFRPARATVKCVAGASAVVILRETTLPLIDLGVTFGIHNQPRQAENALVVVVEGDGRRVGLVVDSLVGQSQVVVKSIEAHYRRVDGLLGATILGDGQVAFILDVSGIVRLAGSRRSLPDATRAA